MATVLLTRHGRTPANVAGVLAGHTPGVGLDEEGQRQAAALATRMAALRLDRVVTSPLQRCRETAEVLTGSDERRGEPVVEDRLVEVRYGEWEGRELSKLAKEPLWKTVQQQPSAVTFPAGESLRTVAQRAVEAVREWDAAIEEEHGPDALWVAVSHGDVVKAVLADALGMHLDQFQRIVVHPCSVSVIHYTPGRPFVSRMNDGSGELDSLNPKRRRRKRRKAAASADAVVGGGVGPAPTDARKV